MAKKRKGKPTWQNLWHKKPEDVSDKAFDKWLNYQEKIQDGYDKAINKIIQQRKNLDKKD